MNVSLAKLAVVLVIGLAITGCSKGSHSSKRQASAADGVQLVSAIDYSLFADEHLADCVRATGAEDTNLQLLDCTDKNISSLDGIEQFNDLRVLIVPQNHIQNVQPLAALPQLAHVDVSSNELNNLSGLEKLQHLTLLDGSNNRLGDASALRGAKSLKRLYLNTNHLQDLAFVSDLSALENLDAENNPRKGLPSLPRSVQTYRL